MLERAFHYILKITSINGRKTMGQLKDHMINFMTVRGYSPKTIKAYTIAVEAMAVYYMKSPLYFPLLM